MEPQNSPSADRVDFVDALRGFALLGVFGANLLVFSGYADFITDVQKEMLPTAGTDKILYLLEMIFVENKFMGLFSFLFGVSFWLFLDRANARGADGRRLFYRRLWWLFVIGAIHGWLFWCFDILRFYALWGVFLPLFVRVSNKKLLSVALFFAVLAPALIRGFHSLLAGPSVPNSAMRALALEAFSSGSYMEFLRVNWLYDWYLTLSVGQLAYQIAILGRLLLGLYVGRALILADLKSHTKLFRALLIGGAIVGIGGNVVTVGQLLNAAAAGGGFLFPFVRRVIAELGYLGLTVAYASGLALLFQTIRWRRILQVLSPIGRMALTCYLSQTVFALWLFYGFMPGPDLMGKIGPTWLILVWLGGYALQVWFASAWLRRFRFGPAEWLWRSLTYWQIQPLRRTVPALGT
jgi:uncharacterized protein